MAASGETALDRLAAFHGIQPAYVSASGEAKAIAAGTKRALLRAMGVEVGDERDAARRLAREEDAAFRRALPPVTVDRTGGEAATLEVTLPRGSERVAFMVCLEDGREATGEAEFGSLELVASRTVDGLPLERRRLPLPPLPLGQHGVSLNEPGVQAALIVTPPACFLPEPLAGGGRTFGVALQLYLLRSAANWGIGDFADLARFAAIAGRHGADVIGLNPLHHLFMDRPEAASPYSPATRLLLNPLYVSIPDTPEAALLGGVFDGPEVRGRIEAARSAPAVDYAAVAALKGEALRTLYAAFRETAGDARRQAFDAFVAAGGESFRDACLFLALRERFSAADPADADWRRWPEEYRSPDAEAALRFPAEAPEAVEYQAYVQFLADEQLAAAAAAARRAGVRIGLYRDLAVGADPSGAETWAGGEAVVRGATVGAPPDIFMPGGQDWMLPPFNPRALREEAYRGFVELVRANMRHAGGIRIDHVMGLLRLWCTPEGASPADGAYVAYPLDDLVGVLALESHRNRCLVVGEDLGTVPEGFRERMAEAGILSYRVLFFEQDFDTGVFTPGADYPPAALAVCGSHDLPTLRGWFAGIDNDLKERLGLFPSAAVTADQRARRERDRDSFLALLRADGLLPEEGDIDEEAFAEAANRFLAETSAGLAVAQLDDIVGERHPVNLPGTVDEHPNWRRKYRLTLEDLEDPAAWACIEPLRRRALRAATTD